MSKTAEADTRGRIVIPADIREKHGSRYRIVELDYWTTIITVAAQLRRMSTEFGTANDPPVGATITLTYEGDWWVASDAETGVTSQGKTRHDALNNLDEALQGYHGGGQPPTEAELREAGIDPEENTSGSIDDSDIFE
mgnify:CR=1 FL=1